MKTQTFGQTRHHCRGSDNSEHFPEPGTEGSSIDYNWEYPIPRVINLQRVSEYYCRLSTFPDIQDLIHYLNPTYIFIPNEILYFNGELLIRLLTNVDITVYDTELKITDADINRPPIPLTDLFERHPGFSRSLTDTIFRYVTFRLFLCLYTKVQQFEFDAIFNYIENRSNGMLIDSPARPFPCDGRYSWIENLELRGSKGNGSFPHCWYRGRYDEGAGDRAWMEEKDRNYLTREGNLRELKPSLIVPALRSSMSEKWIDLNLQNVPVTEEMVMLLETLLLVNRTLMRINLNNTGLTQSQASRLLFSFLRNETLLSRFNLENNSRLSREFIQRFDIHLWLRAAAQGKHEILVELSEVVDINLTDEASNTALHFSVMNNHFLATQYLVDVLRCNVNIRNKRNEICVDLARDRLLDYFKTNPRTASICVVREDAIKVKIFMVLLGIAFSMYKLGYGSQAALPIVAAPILTYPCYNKLGSTFQRYNPVGRLSHVFPRVANSAFGLALAFCGFIVIRHSEENLGVSVAGYLMVASSIYILSNAALSSIERCGVHSREMLGEISRGLSRGFERFGFLAGRVDTVFEREAFTARMEQGAVTARVERGAMENTGIRGCSIM